MNWSQEAPQQDGFIRCVDTADFSIYVRTPLTVTDTGLEFEMVAVKHSRRATGRVAKQALKKALVYACRNYMHHV